MRRVLIEKKVPTPSARTKSDMLYYSILAALNGMEKDDEQTSRFNHNREEIKNNRADFDESHIYDPENPEPRYLRPYHFRPRFRRTAIFQHPRHHCTRFQSPPPI